MRERRMMMEESGFKKVCEHFMELFNPAKQPQISGLFLMEVL